METTRFQCRPELKKPLEEMAHQCQRSTDWVINKALETFLLHTEVEEKRWQETLEALEALEDVAAGRVGPSQKVDAWLDSLGTSDELPRPVG